MISGRPPTARVRPFGARYLLRFDDICPTMNWGMWNLIEDALVKATIRPIMAVIPDNRDPKLRIEPPDPMFWDRVRSWQARGWAIGVHGHHHRPIDQARRMIGSAGWSEFVGRGFAEQDAKVEKALAIFANHEVRADAWIAPNHSFDATTVSILRRRGLHVIVDSFSLFPHRDDEGMMWVPQQLWDLRRRAFGVWTVCFHHNRWGEDRLRAFVDALDRYQSRITDLASILDEYGRRRRSRLDRAFELWARRGRPNATEPRAAHPVRSPVDASGPIERRD